MLVAPNANATPTLQHANNKTKYCECGSVHIMQHVPTLHELINGNQVTTLAYDKRDAKDKANTENNSGIVTWVNHGVVKATNLGPTNLGSINMTALLGRDKYGQYGLTCIGCGKEFTTASSRIQHERKVCKLVKKKYPDWNEKSLVERKRLAMEVAQKKAALKLQCRYRSYVAHRRLLDLRATYMAAGVEETKG